MSWPQYFMAAEITIFVLCLAFNPDRRIKLLGLVIWLFNVFVLYKGGFFS